MAPIPHDLETGASPPDDPMPDYNGRVVCSCGTTVKLAKEPGHGTRVCHKCCNDCVEKERQKQQADHAMALLQQAITDEAEIRVRVQPWLMGSVKGMRLTGTGDEITGNERGFLRIRRPAEDEAIVELASPGGSWIAVEARDLFELFKRLGYGSDNGSDDFGA